MYSFGLFWTTIFVHTMLIVVNGVANDKGESVPVDAEALVKGRISCYVCNSDNKDQQNCSSSNVDELKDFITVCPPLHNGPLAGKEAGSCRKVLQNFGDESNVVRECAYTGEEPVDGKRRTGNKGITLYIYQCFNTKSDEPCNSAMIRRIEFLIPVLMLFIFLLAKID